MSKYLDPASAPRDGRIIIGLLEAAFGKRRTSARAAFNIEASDDVRSKHPTIFPHG